MSDETEEWRAVSADGGRFASLYEVSTHGRVRAIADGREIRAALDSNGYPFVVLYVREGGRTRRTRSFRVHVLMLEAFVGPRPAGSVSRHLNGDPEGNTLPNLAWGSRRDNAKDAIEHGRNPLIGSNPTPRKLTPEMVLAIRQGRQRGATFVALGRAFGIATESARRACVGKTYADIHGDQIAPSNTGTLRGDAHPRRKLTAEDVIEIRRERASGATAVGLARKYGVSDSTVANICNGYRWKHVPMDATA